MRSFIALCSIAAVFSTPVSAQSFTPFAERTQDRDITVTGKRESMSNWWVAETDNVIVISSGSEENTTRIAHNLERLHFLITSLLPEGQHHDTALKLQVTLVGDAANFNQLRLRNLRMQHSPLPPAFTANRFYDPREDGPLMATSRHDHVVTLSPGVDLQNLVASLNTVTAPTLPPGMEMPREAGAHSLAPNPGTTLSFGSSPQIGRANSVMVTLPPETQIYAEFARHYLLTHFPQAYPLWYVDGFGMLFSTMEVRKDGAIEFGRAPPEYTKVMDHYPRYPARNVLSGQYLSDKRALTRWSPYHMWVLTHMLFFDDARRQEMRGYLAKIASGASAAEASALFGDMDAFERALAAYDNRRIPYVEVRYPSDRTEAPFVRRLTEGEVAYVKGKLESNSRLYVGTAASLAGTTEDTPSEAASVELREQWLLRLRADARRFPANLQTYLLLAEAECRTNNIQGCTEAANRAVEIDPTSGEALAWQGWSRTAAAVAGPPAQRAFAVKAGRATIVRANRLAPDHPVPLILYYRSFVDAGEAPSDAAVAGLMKASDQVPASPTTRLMLGEALAKRGAMEAARRILAPVAFGAYRSPETPAARQLLESLSD